MNNVGALEVLFLIYANICGEKCKLSVFFNMSKVAFAGRQWSADVVSLIEHVLAQMNYERKYVIRRKPRQM
jgi:hypothetical protein